MKIGVVFPQTEIGTDPTAITDYVQACEGMGYDHVIAFDHVMGANPGSRLGWSGTYSHVDMFHEPFVLFGFLSGITKRIKFVTAVIILPQRQSALVAKQAATLDVLSEGRLRLGIGIGWNDVEYEALGENFHNRGIRSEEQIEVMRALWTQDLVTYDGRWHKIVDAGINPLPVQRPIPIWIGGGADVVLRRIAKIGDGWFPQIRPDAEGQAKIEKLWQYARSEGRETSSIGIESWISIRNKDGSIKDPAEWRNEIISWERVGATHISVNTMGAGLDSPQKHIEVVASFKNVADQIIS